LWLVSEASDGLEAVRQAHELQPDMVVLDIGLPKLHGIEAARRIRDKCPETKILFLTERRSAEIVQEALRIGANGYIVKSDAVQLLAAVEAIRENRIFLSKSLAAASPDIPDRHYERSED
jgi:DNA-binding NarL/FixJ family response regulator